MYSRKIKIEEFRNKKKAFLFIILTILILIILFFFGLPLLIKFTAFLTELNQLSQPVEINDTTPPPPPKIYSLPTATNQEKIEIKGNTESGAKITLFLNNKEDDIILSDASGNFSYFFSLQKGDNIISAKSTDSSGNESDRSEIIKIKYDNEPPILEIIKPSDRSEFYGSRQRQLIIEGKTEKNVSVTINQRSVSVDSEGIFVYSVTLTEGENKFKIYATDEAENKTEKSISVIYYP